MPVTSQVWVEEANERHRTEKCLLCCYVIRGAQE